VLFRVIIVSEGFGSQKTLPVLKTGTCTSGEKRKSEDQGCESSHRLIRQVICFNVTCREERFAVEDLLMIIS